MINKKKTNKKPGAKTSAKTSPGSRTLKPRELGVGAAENVRGGVMKAGYEGGQAAIQALKAS